LKLELFRLERLSLKKMHEIPPPESSFGDDDSELDPDILTSNVSDYNYRFYLKKNGYVNYAKVRNAYEKPDSQEAILNAMKEFMEVGLKMNFSIKFQGIKDLETLLKIGNHREESDDG